MRAVTAVVVAAVAIALTWQSADAAQSSSQKVRSVGECGQLAKARGWTRPYEKGRWPFIKRCMEGRIS